ncbi:MAG: phosphoribosylamine--glycine ligase [Oscillospiraceae bacterium]|nr:phosphoribosylamine--glycine ligase [Oscillospiraceae bacterium]
MKKDKDNVVLVVGSGGREHAIVRKLRESAHVGTIYAAPGNGGTARDAINVPIKATDVEGIVAFAKAHQVDMVMVAPDDPLMLGMVDALTAAGIPAFGPVKAAAEIEGSKVFAKNLMKKYHIPTAGYEVFDSAEDARQYIRTRGSYPIVIKADGLALGKGVIIAESWEEAEDAVNSIMVDRRFGKSGEKIVVEEFLTGPEVSVLCFTDGKTICPMVSSMDHKRAYDEDKGPNTGGMGAVAPNPFYTHKIAEECMETIFRPTVNAMNMEGRTFKGVLYFGLMLTPRGPKVIEYNSRFGDPETQVVLRLLKCDLFEVFDAVINGTLDQIAVVNEKGCAACVVAASGGYPGSYESGFRIEGLRPTGQLPLSEDVEVFHAGTKWTEEEVFLTSGGRILCVSATAADLKSAVQIAYRAMKQIQIEGAFYRKDIGQRALEEAKNLRASR